LRGGYDPSDRITGILAVVAPFLTTVVAFLFGARVGTGEAKVAQVEKTQAQSQARAERKRADQASAHTSRVINALDVTQQVKPDATASDLYESLRKQGLVK
jgi:hypothetical protein